jgi:UDP-3-O-[3-hydroxymyristoyl] glucosamine N-acyltransferase
LKLKELAARLNCSLEGDGDVDIVRVAGIQDAQPGDVTFVANAKYAAQLAATRASAVIVSDALASAARPTDARSYALLRTPDPYSAFARALTCFIHTKPPASGIDRLSSIAGDAVIGSDVSIGPFVVVGSGASIGARTVIFPNVVIGAGARIGDDCVLHSHVSVRDRVVVGSRVVLHDGVVVGSDGFGFARQADGTHLKIPQEAPVVIEDDVEIGANSAIDRPAVGETRIRTGTKIDNLVHIAHGVTIGERSLLAAQSGVAGSTTIDSDVMIAGQSGVNGHMRIGRGVKIGAKSAVLQSVEAGAFVTGHPAMPHADWRKATAIFRRLPSLKKRVVDLEQRLTELEEKLSECPTRPDR